MNSNELKPKYVFEQFARINTIPRPSKREEKMIEYLRQWGESHGLETVVDETGNVLIRKGATPGYEDRKTVVLHQLVADRQEIELFDGRSGFADTPVQQHVELVSLLPAHSYQSRNINRLEERDHRIWSLHP